MAYFERYASDALLLLSERKSVPHTRAMLALFIPPSAGLQLLLPGGEPINQLHITLVSFEEAEHLSEALFAAGCSPKMLRKRCANLASEFGPLFGHVAGVGCFTANQDERPFLALVDIPELPKFHHKVCHMLKEMGIVWQTNHGYTPHITLKYLEQGESFPIIALPSIPLEFSGFTLAIGERRYFFPFGDGIQKKHLPGEHDQESHAHRTGGIDMQSEFNRLQSPEERDDYLREQGRGWEKSLSYREKDAFEAYTNTDYIPINEAKRQDAQLSPANQATADAMDSALEKSSAPSDMTVYRGLSWDIFSSLEEGTSFQDKGFVSTTLDEGVAEFDFGGMAAEIFVPKGSPGAYIAPFSRKPHEMEWLLPSNSQFKVLSKEGSRVSLLYTGKVKQKRARRFSQKTKNGGKHFSWQNGDIVINSKKYWKHDQGEHNQANHGRRYGTSSDGERVQQSGAGIPEKASGKVYSISELLSSPVIKGLDDYSLSFSGKTTEENAENVLYHMQGYDGKPHVVDSLNSYVAAGERELFRGIDNTKGDAQKLAEAYRSGDLFAGKGVFGNGTYVVYGELSEKVVAGYAGEDGAQLRMTLRPDAKIISYDDAVKMTIQARQAVRQRVDSVTQDSSLSKNEKHDILNKLDWIDDLMRDPGRAATALGYDAIDVTDRKFMAILNRTATRVEKKK